MGGLKGVLEDFQQKRPNLELNDTIVYYIITQLQIVTETISITKCINPMTISFSSTEEMRCQSY